MPEFPADEGWDWPWLMYLGTVLLKMPEERFWRTTPRTLTALVRVHQEVNDPEQAKKPKKAATKQVFIDQILPL